MFREGLRITPVRLFDKGRFCRDVAHLIAANTRDPASIIGDIHAQAQATQVCEREILRLVGKYGRETVETGLSEVQDYVERAMRQRLAALPDGVWETQDFIDRDPAGSEGLIPIKVNSPSRAKRPSMISPAVIRRSAPSTIPPSARHSQRLRRA
jgi:N-methylhydantoinase B